MERYDKKNDLLNNTVKVSEKILPKEFSTSITYLIILIKFNIKNISRITMKTILVFLLLFACNFKSYNIFAQPVTQEWLKRWPEASSVSSKGISVKQDSFGFIYVLADTSNGYGFLKYNSNGDLLLHATYWPGGSFTSGAGEFFDVTSIGDVYITGGIYIDLDSWICIVKFNSSGVFQWGKLYNRDIGDAVKNIKVDKLGNVIIVGSSYDGTTNFALTLKYNSLGDTLWTRYFNQPPNYPAGNSKLVLDNLDNIYIVGYIIVPSIPGKCLILKYDTNGILKWFSTFTLDPSRSNLGLGISIDTNKNVYVIGTQKRPQNQYDSYILKLDNIGDTIWSRINTHYGPGTILYGGLLSRLTETLFITQRLYTTQLVLATILLH